MYAHTHTHTHMHTHTHFILRSVLSSWQNWAERTETFHIIPVSTHAQPSPLLTC